MSTALLDILDPGSTSSFLDTHSLLFTPSLHGITYVHQETPGLFLSSQLWNVSFQNYISGWLVALSPWCHQDVLFSLPSEYMELCTHWQLGLGGYIGFEQVWIAFCRLVVTWQSQLWPMEPVLPPAHRIEILWDSRLTNKDRTVTIRWQKHVSFPSHNSEPELSEL